ncbi:MULTISPECIES: hypothetical protein [Azospirillum]|jgi:hypothetical protein|uniref:Uncharacterized protein n=1 Tax=Azospirillum brasilense TaxID=192 RepID=A0ABU4PDN4_AZOBR|nr:MULTISPECIES: hypothetical protein [Azospirillum]MDW7553247.1 hypothetical protein [Azospirillum brasilense]MDW7593374.1 hypothetical protein [Azospirillum brasilense]MDW7628566.1 hypothetical protein [Azospirillum brasilense]MDX5955339.1 hypothetical protein [Azospirillum brasilense]
MGDISIGAVGAAIVAGLVSLLGLIIGKEQKVSEFRQAWIDELRKCIVAYLVNINAISDSLRLKKSGQNIEAKEMVSQYKLLNEASNGIKLRINSDERPAKALLKAMGEFESIANNNDNITPEKIRSAEQEFLKASRKLLKFEWNRVKRGEKTFVWTKIVLFIAVLVMVCILAFQWTIREKSIKAKAFCNNHDFQFASALLCTSSEKQ